MYAGELVWITDRTPHESLPITDLSKRRQFFRLVVGEISYWFADHSTSNPTGFELPSNVPIFRGNKFTLYREIPTVWEFGSKNEFYLAKERAKFREILYKHSIGFLADVLARNFSIYDRNGLFEKKYEIFSQFLPNFLKDESKYTRIFVEARLHDLLWEN
jgi:hypothetical protein